MLAEKKAKRKPLALEFRQKGKGRRKCRFCGNARGMIRSFGLQTCRRCFREVAENVGFRKF